MADADEVEARWQMQARDRGEILEARWRRDGGEMAAATKAETKAETKARRRRDGGETKAEMEAIWKEGRPHGGDDEGER